MNLEGKVAIVTGAAGGIGRAITRELADQGANVIAVDLDKERIDVIAMEIREAGRKAFAVQADVTNAGQVNQMVSQALESFQRIDILVNNAGGSGHIGVDQIEDVSEELWDATVDLNLKAAFLCCKAVVPTMKAQRYGKIVNFSSSSAFGAFGPRGTSAARLPYAGAKAGIIGFSSQLAKDLGPFGINVNTVIPGFINTGPDARVG
ncbi:MAG: SDR family oxidoreductase, partial [Candidatus Tectomicrobia bacterium]|nr:SDR family oxidoreductase [Candidatus Tectomicrobia bacterium]